MTKKKMIEGKFQRPPRDERPPLRCYQDAAIVCDPKHLRLAPRNICARTETKCRRLKRKLKMIRRNPQPPARATDRKPGTVIGEYILGGRA